MARRRLKRKPEPEGLVEVSSLLEGALQALGVRGDFEKFKVEKACREILGDKFSQALTAVSIKGRVVKIEFNHSIWMNEVTFRKAELLLKLQKQLPEVGIKTLDVGLSRKS